MIPNRSLSAKSAKSVFFEEINDIDIYIEDTAHGYEKLFAILFSRVFEGKYQIGKVFPLGGRGSVIDAHKSFSKNGRPTLFVVDGDLYLLAGDDVEDDDGLYRVPFYCIENVLCDPDAIHNLLNEEHTTASKEQLAKEFDYQGWLSENENLLFELFVEYAVSFSLNPTQQTVSFSIRNLVSSNSGSLDECKTHQRINEVREATIQSSEKDKYKKTREKVLRNFDLSGSSKFDVVSGKDYLFPLLKTRIRSTVKTKVPDINLKIRLAMNCDVSGLMDAHLRVAC